MHPLVFIRLGRRRIIISASWDPTTSRTFWTSEKDKISAWIRYWRGFTHRLLTCQG